MNNFKTNEQILFVRILLYGSLIFSQGIIWNLIELIPNINDNNLIKYFPIFQSISAVFYLLFSLFFTEDISTLHIIFNKYPIIKKFVNFIIDQLFHIVFTSLFFLIGMMKSLCIDKSDKISEKAVALQTTQNIIQASQLFQTAPIIFRLLMGASCLGLILIITTPFVDTIFISIVSDTMSSVAAIIGCIFVVNNAKQHLIMK